MKERYILIFLLWIVAQKSYAQYNFVAKKILTTERRIEINSISGGFKPIESYKNNNCYQFNSEGIDIKYLEPFNDEKCGEFIICNTRINLEGKFYNDQLACDLDVNSFQVYKFSFSRRKYILIQSIKKASGAATSCVIFHLFDITDSRKVHYYPLWSFYGSVLCFSDFNKDNKLDFLEIRDNWRQTGSDTFKATIATLNNINSRFVSSEKNKFITFKRTYNKNSDMQIAILEKKWI